MQNGDIDLDRFIQIRAAVRAQNSMNSLERICTEYMLSDPREIQAAVTALTGALNPALKITPKEMAAALRMAFKLAYDKTDNAFARVENQRNTS